MLWIMLVRSLHIRVHEQLQFDPALESISQKRFLYNHPHYHSYEHWLVNYPPSHTEFGLIVRRRSYRGPQASSALGYYETRRRMSELTELDELEKVTR